MACGAGSVVHEHVAMLKTDTQGHELHVRDPAIAPRSNFTKEKPTHSLTEAKCQQDAHGHARAAMRVVRRC